MYWVGNKQVNCLHTYPSRYRMEALKFTEFKDLGYLSK